LTHQIGDVVLAHFVANFALLKVLVVFVDELAGAEK
jgi:hypothetical protein